MLIQISGANKIGETDKSIAYLTQMDEFSIIVTTTMPFSVVCIDKWKFNNQTLEDEFEGTITIPILFKKGSTEISISSGDSLRFAFYEGLPGLKISEMPKEYIITRD